MKLRLRFLLPIGVLLLVLGTVAAACGDDDGDESDEDAIRNVVQEINAATNDRDFDRIAELSTADFETTSAFRAIEGDPDFRIEDVAILSVMVADDEATVVLTHGGSHQSPDTGDTIFLRREDGRWLIDIIR